MENSISAGDVKTKPIMTDALSQLKNAWEIFKKNWQQLIALNLIPIFLSIIVIILGFLLKWINFVSFKEVLAMTAVNSTNVFSVYGLNFKFVAAASLGWWQFLLMGIGFVVFIIISLLISVGQLIVLKHDGEKLSWSDLFKKSWPYMLKYFLAGLLYGILVMIGFVLLIIPGVLFAIWYGFIYLGVVFDELGVMASLKNSKELVKGHWWAVMGRLVLWGVIVLGINIIFAIILYSSKNDIINILYNLITLVVGPFSVIYYMVVYKDLKKIKNI